MCYYFWGVSPLERGPEEKVRVEAMGFTWVLPWKTVQKDVESGFAILIDAPAV